MVLALALVAVLAVGFGLGATLGLPSSGDNLSVPAADSVDVGFAQDMTVHHQQGVQMATVAYTGAVDPYVRSLAFDIMTSQLAQVGQMQGWLSLWGRPLAPSGAYMTWMSDAGGHHGAASSSSGAGAATMPGMASAAEISQLRAATGPELDTLFLQLMLRHHQGGAEMLSHAADRAVEPVVRNLAKQAAATQQAESTYLSDLLTQRGATPLPLGN
ncbi:DUF305 domain-containing protein [Rhodococcus sp. X156]|uniref:DUF305 domain-containing protein n=1 Tax=Rhodococcus sp. X156 TaxID=2499145 RepID=UPI001F4975FC|nr:DUF305 domain-containing protein [Rhodococcus sp. X156]